MNHKNISALLRSPLCTGRCSKVDISANPLRPQSRNSNFQTARLIRPHKTTICTHPGCRIRPRPRHNKQTIRHVSSSSRASWPDPPPPPRPKPHSRCAAGPPPAAPQAHPPPSHASANAHAMHRRRLSPTRKRRSMTDTRARPSTNIINNNTSNSSRSYLLRHIHPRASAV